MHRNVYMCVYTTRTNISNRYHVIKLTGHWLSKYYINNELNWWIYWWLIIFTFHHHLCKPHELSKFNLLQYFFFLLLSFVSSISIYSLKWCWSSDYNLPKIFTHRVYPVVDVINNFITYGNECSIHFRNNHFSSSNKPKIN